jgi:hypothetical protein
MRLHLLKAIAINLGRKGQGFQLSLIVLILQGTLRRIVVSNLHKGRFNMDSITEGNLKENRRNPIFLVVMGIGALVVAGILVWLLMTPTPQQNSTPRLENALREGPEFENLKKKIVIDRNEDFTTEQRSLSGDLSMSLVGVVRNFTGKTLTGLEVVGSVVDSKGNVIREKTAIVLPNTDYPKLDPNKTMPIAVVINGFEKNDDRANFKWQIKGLKVE